MVKTSGKILKDIFGEENSKKIEKTINYINPIKIQESEIAPSKKEDDEFRKLLGIDVKPMEKVKGSIGKKEEAEEDEDKDEKNKKKASSNFGMIENLRKNNKHHLDNNFSQLSSGRFFEDVEKEIPDHNDPYYYEKLNEIKKNYINGISRNLSASSLDIFTGIRKKLIAAGALDNQTDSELRNAYENEHRMAIRHAVNFTNKNFEKSLSKYMEGKRLSNLREQESKLKDTMIRNGNEYELAEGKKLNTKDLAKTVSSNSVIDMLNKGTERFKSKNEDDKVENLSKLLKADKPVYMLR